MSLSACPECSNDTCDCGYQYKHWPIEDKVDLANKLVGDDYVLVPRIELVTLDLETQNLLYYLKNNGVDDWVVDTVALNLTTQSFKVATTKVWT